MKNALGIKKVTLRDLDEHGLKATGGQASEPPCACAPTGCLTDYSCPQVTNCGACTQSTCENTWQCYTVVACSTNGEATCVYSCQFGCSSGC